ncbi:hypothetical protein DFH08DRAFT_1073794 [Mycena albidolilacea]|uniref:DUF6533 domain-containing protein n=1 Tax=Mycena albidolilacea TaxID=1033008 RepID=A0AAD7AME7_9AGAR|nr:hypothetical protein DFH08DRAFT_1073794 [Mycena albidolilacea]
MDGSFSEADALASTRLQAVKYFDVVAIVILVFEYCLTFNLEVSLIWPSRWSLTKILYILSRYPAFFDVPLVLYYLNPTVSIEHCAQINTAIAAGNVFGIAIAEAIFVLRTYALSGRQRTVLITFGTLYSVFLVATVSMMAIFLRNMIYSPPLPHVPGCNLTGGPFTLVGLSFILVLLNETALMSYTLWIGVKTYRHTTSPLVTTLYRDGVTYYVFLFLGSAANVAILIGAPKQLRELLNTPLRVLHSVLSTRALLHVRKAERERSERTVATHTTSAGSVHFANDLTIMSRG